MELEQEVPDILCYARVEDCIQRETSERGRSQGFYMQYRVFSKKILLDIQSIGKSIAI